MATLGAATRADQPKARALGFEECRTGRRGAALAGAHESMAIEELLRPLEPWLAAIMIADADLLASRDTSHGDDDQGSIQRLPPGARMTLVIERGAEWEEALPI